MEESSDEGCDLCAKVWITAIQSSVGIGKLRRKNRPFLAQCASQLPIAVANAILASIAGGAAPF